MIVSIIDYGMGNLRSIQNALDFLGVESRLVRDPETVRRADKLVLPGVGAFQKAMSNLHQELLVPAILDAVRAGTPLLGICLGMQLLAERGEEGGPMAGLGVIPGTVKRFQVSHDLRVPHMGFNEVEFVHPHPFFAGIEDKSHFYFTHSFHFACDANAVVGVARHGRPFAAIVAKDNVFGAQFHPEKSQSSGLQMLKNFCRLDPC